MKLLRPLLLAAALAAPFHATAALESIVPFGPRALLGGGTTSAADPSLAGTVIADTGGAFTGAGFSGTFQTRVVQPDALPGTLDFYYRITSFTDSATNRVLRDFRIGGFADFDTSVTYRPDGVGDLAPAQAIRFPQPAAPTSDGLNFSFADLPGGVASEFDSGDTSFFFLVRSNATAYTTVGADVYLVTRPSVPFDQFLSNGFLVYAPAEIPEPGTFALMLGGLLALFTVMRRRS